MSEPGLDPEFAPGPESAVAEPLVRVEGLTKHFTQGSGLLASVFDSPKVKAVDDVTFDIAPGETLGLVGESGCGKSTLARTILKLVEPTAGAVYFKGENIATLSGEQLRRQRRDMQMIFQDPQSSLDPRMKVGPIVEEPMRAHGMPDRSREMSGLDAVSVSAPSDIAVTPVLYEDADMVLGNHDVRVVVERVQRPADDAERAELEARHAHVRYLDERAVLVDVDADRPVAFDVTLEARSPLALRVDLHAAVSNGDVRERRARDLLESVGLDPQHYNRYPHQFSGGQRQRINLARALSVNPDFIVCDEPVSSLDVSIQAQVLNTMRDLQEEFGLTYLFIAHDLSVIRHISDRVAVMYLGQLVELADTEELYENPQHPYTRALLQSIPVPDPRSSGHRAALEGDVPSPIEPPSGCRFRTRCPHLIAPPTYDFTDEQWDAVRRFMRAVTRRTFEAPDERTVDETFFAGVTLSGEAREVVYDAISAVAVGDWEVATEMLETAFATESICARELPAYEVRSEVAGDRHFVACHLHREGGEGI